MYIKILKNLKKEQRGVILFLFTIFFEYACYIFNLYEEKLIQKLAAIGFEYLFKLFKMNRLSAF